MPTLSLDPQRWDFRFGQNMPPHPDYGAFSFIFPGEGGEVDYLTQTVSMAASKRVVVVSQIVAMSGVPVFHAHQDPGGAVSDAYATIMLQRKGDNMVNEDGRWWARKHRIPLKLGVFVKTEVSLTDLDEWSNVQGHIATARPSQFAACCANIEAIGLTFGGQSFGHGAHTSGGVARMMVPRFLLE